MAGARDSQAVSALLPHVRAPLPQERALLPQERAILPPVGVPRTSVGETRGFDVSVLQGILAPKWPAILVPQLTELPIMPITSRGQSTGASSDTKRWGRIPAWWLDHPDLDADGLAVLAALSTFADEHGVCWPSQSTLADKLKRSRPTINRILQRLDALGLVAIERRRGRDGSRLSCLYRLRFSAADTPNAARAAAVAPADRDDSAAYIPCPAPSQEHLQPEQIPDSPAPRELAGSSEVPSGWVPTPADLSWAQDRHPDVDLAQHIEGFILRCHAHGYRYRNISAAWRAWLSQDVAAGTAPRQFARPALGRLTVRPAHGRETRGEQRFDAWATVAAELQRVPASSWV